MKLLAYKNIVPVFWPTLYKFLESAWHREPEKPIFLISKKYVCTPPSSLFAAYGYDQLFLMVLCFASISFTSIRSNTIYSCQLVLVWWWFVCCAVNDHGGQVAPWEEENGFYAIMVCWSLFFYHSRRLLSLIYY